MPEIMPRKSFPEGKAKIQYEAVEWRPKFEELYNAQKGEQISIVLRNKETQGLERLEFHIVGATESPITTTKWIWGRIHTDDGTIYDIDFDYVDGILIDIYAFATAKSAPVEATRKRAESIRYAAEITNFDIFSPVEED